MNEAPVVLTAKPVKHRGQRLRQSFSRLGESAEKGLSRFGERIKNRASRLGSGVQRSHQLLAAICLPFTVVIAMAAAEVIDAVIVSLVPSNLGPVVTMTQFIVGTALFVGAFVIQFAWVKTGGFGIFNFKRRGGLFS